MPSPKKHHHSEDLSETDSIQHRHRSPNRRHHQDDESEEREAEQVVSAELVEEEEVAQTPEEPTGTRKRRNSKPSGPRLNTWDVPEFMPGALPGASALEKAHFEARSKKVFQNDLIMDEIEAEASKERAELELTETLEADMITLRDLFPLLDIDLIQESYLECEYDVTATINQLLIVSEGAESPSGPKQGPPASDDGTAFPVLTTADGWQVLPGLTSNPVTSTQYRDKVVDNHKPA